MHGAFILALLGYDRVRNYDGSMGEWANRDHTPMGMETGGWRSDLPYCRQHAPIGLLCPKGTLQHGCRHVAATLLANPPVVC